MYILNREMRDNFVMKLAKKNSYVLTFSSRLIKNHDDIAFGAKMLYLSGTPFDERGGEDKRQPRMTNEEDVERTLEPFVKKLWNYFNASSITMSSQSDFNTFHEELCDLFLSIFAAKEFHHTYGNAQKFTNILFKYLSCYKDAPNFEEKFRYCHMAIDRYTYNGYRIPFYRDVVYKTKSEKYDGELVSWSKLEKSSNPGYKEISSDIIKYITKNPKTFNEYLNICSMFPILTHIKPLEEDRVLTAFEAEFFIWEICKSYQTKNKDKKYIYSKNLKNSIIALL